MSHCVPADFHRFGCARDVVEQGSLLSADSLAAVAPFAPIAMPTSAAASTGASFTPSPTMITGRLATAAASCYLVEPAGAQAATLVDADLCGDVISPWPSRRP